VLAAVAALMVSRVPTFSLKRFRVPREWVLPVLIAIGGAAAFLTTAPWGTLLAVGAVYIASIPIGIWRYRRLARTAAGPRNPQQIGAPQRDEDAGAAAPRAERG
jgi:CDP-diacylglycerol--serine O-phosphatidyltransferase